ncbi:MAG TPA: cytochrome c-type biogenesis protein CcmH [Gammaproteobacteria bacterium]|nr:cytochrome c-type biogenesis protein CcmH [Gammaproteobacteria bacterium]HIK71764.1 cytochrome c-type biogenesis protein CcmH [Gammaproteobacteria bacterium]
MRTAFYLLILVAFQAILLAEPNKQEVRKELYPFDNIQDEIRFNRLIEDYRCPKCQSSNLSGSNAPIAKDLKLEIYKLIKKGNKDDEIAEFLTQRYGNFILYKPPFITSTYILWIGPFAFLFCILICIFLIRRSHKRQATTFDGNELKDKIKSALEDR